MENEIKHRIGGRQAARFVLAIQLAIGILSLPKDVTKQMGLNGWMSVVAGGLFMVGGILATITLCKKFGGRSILDIQTELFGRAAGFVLNLLVTFYTLAAAVVNFRYLIQRTGAWYFRATPLWVLATLLILPGAYLIYKGLKGLSRFNVLVYVIGFILVEVLAWNILNSFRPTLLMPVSFSPELQTWGSGVFATAFAYMGYECLLFIFPFIQNTKRLIRHTLFTSVLVILLFSAVTILSIGVYGEGMVIDRTLPVVGLFRLIKFPIFERVDLYLLAAWIPGMAICVYSYFFCVYYSAKKTFGIRSDLLLVGFLTLLLIVLGSYTEDTNFSFLSGRIVGLGAFILGLVIPLLWLLLAWITGKGQRGEEIH